MLSENIKKARKKLNISQRELGRRIGKTGQYISFRGTRLYVLLLVYDIF